MKLKISGRNVTLLGDPHLGRRFINGVPLDRRGEREKMVWEDLLTSLMSAPGDIHINLGDLFDKSVVPLDVIAQAAYCYQVAAGAHPETEFYVLAGNHDLSKDIEKTSALDVFSMIVDSVENIHVITRPTEIDDIPVLLCPYLQDENYAEALEAMTVDRVEYAFGHWDVESFGGSEDNLIPTKVLAKMGVTHAYTGHVHLPDEFERDGVKVTVVGSMQPYTHAEDANGSLYKTFTLGEIHAVLEQAPETIKNKCVRVVLKPGESLDTQINCLQLTVKRQNEKDEDDIGKVTLGEFDIDRLMKEVLKEAGVSEEVSKTVVEKFAEGKMFS